MSRVLTKAWQNVNFGKMEGNENQTEGVHCERLNSMLNLQRTCQGLQCGEKKPRSAHQQHCATAGEWNNKIGSRG